ncbi:hypothetical protein N7454_005802 [Penicillium verhagenii]|nr:hypothetical protein N7454_005802 [Penicillium verhagenii]
MNKGNMYAICGGLMRGVHGIPNRATSFLGGWSSLGVEKWENRPGPTSSPQIQRGYLDFGGDAAEGPGGYGRQPQNRRRQNRHPRLDGANIDTPDSTGPTSTPHTRRGQHRHPRLDGANIDTPYSTGPTSTPHTRRANIDTQDSPGPTSTPQTHRD